MLSLRRTNRGPRALSAGAVMGGMAVASVMLIGCGGIGPGDYVIYRVAFSEQRQSAGCYPNGQIPPNVLEDSSTFRAADTIIIYGGMDEKFYLDAGGGQTLAGVATDDGFSFDGSDVDVTYQGLNDEVKTTERLYTSIDVTLDGALIDGAVQMTHTLVCVAPGTGCGAPPPDFTCETSFDFVGTEVEDVQLKHDV